jgi:hypothetical protein
MMEKVFNEYVVGQFDDAADLMMCKFLHDRQPPQSLLSHQELGLPASAMDQLQFEDGKPLGGGNAKGKPAMASTDSGASGQEEASGDDADADDKMDEDDGGDDDEPITLETRVKLASKYAVRLVVEGTISRIVCQPPRRLTQSHGYR